MHQSCDWGWAWCLLLPVGNRAAFGGVPLPQSWKKRLPRFKSFPVILNQGGRRCRLAFGFFLGLGLGIADFG